MNPLLMTFDPFYSSLLLIVIFLPNSIRIVVDEAGDYVYVGVLFQILRFAS